MPRKTITEQTKGRRIEDILAASDSLRDFVRGGDEGGCVACRKPISSHVDKHGTWLGCPEGSEDTTFILVPVKSIRSNGQVVTRQAAPAAPQRTITSPRPVVSRPRFRYQVVDRRRTYPELSARRAQVYNALLKSPNGLVYKDLKTRTHLVHGTIQQTLNWLRNAKLVKAAEVE